MLEAMPKNINSVSHLTCCYPPFSAKSVVKCSSHACCAALCHWVLLSVEGEKVPGAGHLQGSLQRERMFSCVWLASLRAVTQQLYIWNIWKKKIMVRANLKRVNILFVFSWEISNHSINLCLYLAVLYLHTVAWISLKCL